MMAKPAKWNYPNVYDEASSMINLSTLIYTYSELRKFARANPQRYQGEDHILSNEEVTGKDLVMFVKMNKDVLKEDIDNDKKAVYHYHVLVTLIQKLEKAGMPAMKQSKVVAFDDKDAESELVHGITINPVERRISIIFRGSVTTSDWYANLQAWATKHPNPLKDFKGQPDTLGLHSGFYEYLMEENDDGDRSKFENIFRTVKKLCKKYPKFTVYCSGHSLGGALCSLFAFLLATKTDSSIKKPIRCISFASPLVGDRNWREAFMLAEQQHLIRYLRVTNDKDFVPTIPTISLFSMTAYKHVGIHVRLLGHGQYRISYPTNGKSDKEDLRKNSLINTLGIGMGKLHTSIAYDRQIRVAKEALSRLYLENLYDDKNLIGKSTILEDSDTASL